MKARDVMSSPAVVLYEGQSVRDAAVRFARTGCAVLPVVGDDGRMIGIVGESDVLGVDTASGALADRPVTAIMTTSVRSVTLDAEVSLAARDMLLHRLRCVPVVYDGKPVGVLCCRNVLAALIRADEVIATNVAGLLRSYGGPARRWSVSVSSGTVSVAGEFADEAERRVLTALARTEPGVFDVELVPALAAAAPAGHDETVGNLRVGT